MANKPYKKFAAILQIPVVISGPELTRAFAAELLQERLTDAMETAVGHSHLPHVNIQRKGRTKLARLRMLKPKC